MDYKTIIKQLLNKSVNAATSGANTAKAVTNKAIDKSIEIGKDTKAVVKQLLGRDVNAIDNRVNAIYNKAAPKAVKDTNNLSTALIVQDPAIAAAEAKKVKDAFKALENKVKLNAGIGAGATTVAGGTLYNKLFGTKEASETPKKSFKDYLKSL